MKPPVRWSSCILLLCLARPCPAAERYFVVVFGAERNAVRLKYTHSFAAFVRACGDGPEVESWDLDAFTISWMPATLEIKLGAPKPEPGVNLDLSASLRVAQAAHDHVYQWGPFEIDPELYYRAAQQVQVLESGTVLYKGNDAGWPADRVSCVHALLDIADGRPAVGPLSLAYGKAGSSRIAWHFRPWLIQPEQVHPWVGARLGLDAYPIVHCDLADPHFLGPLRGRSRDAP
jgi:hypothetical protein